MITGGKFGLFPVGTSRDGLAVSGVDGNGRIYFRRSVLFFSHSPTNHTLGGLPNPGMELS